MRFPHSSRRGALALAITAAVLVAVVLLNIGASALFGGRLLFWDLTNESMYRLNDETVNLMKQTVAEAKELYKDGEQEEKVTILFCADPDLLVQNEQMRYIYYTARALAKKFSSFIDLKTVDVWSNPSSVDRYRINSYSSIYQTDVIVASGSESRILGMDSFYTYSDTNSETPWAYNGEKTFVKTIRAITRVEAPVCCVVTNHGGALAEEGSHTALLNTVKGAGFQIQMLNLATEEIPEECRMILIFDPQTDFSSGNYLSGEAGELGKLDVYLRKANSLLLFADPQTPTLTNLETFLEEWGIRFSRYQNPEDELETLGNYRVVSPMDSIDGNAGRAVLAEYEIAGMGASITKKMRAQGSSPAIVFPNAAPLELSPTYSLEISLKSENNTARYEYGRYAKNNEVRSIYKIFSSTGADRLTYAEVVGTNGEVLPGVTDARGDYALATITFREDSLKEIDRVTGQSKRITNNSMLCVFGSTDFADDALLCSSAYGNNDLLLEIMNGMSREALSVGFDSEPLHKTNMGSDFYTASGNRTAAIVLALIPATVALGLGIFVLVRRRRAR